jgi:short-subunit dehydrogenase
LHFDIDVNSLLQVARIGADEWTTTMNDGTKGTALITGASAGIGAIYADRLAHDGYDLVLVARDGAKLEALADRLRSEAGRRVDVLSADLTERTGLRSVEERVATDPTLTLLVNNAGAVLHGGILENGAEALERLIALNVTAPTVLAAAAAKAFVSRRAGTIVNIASVLALAPEMLEGVYSGTKAFVLNLSRKLALDVKASGVHVQVVLPGATRTEIWDRSGTDISGMPEDTVMEAGDLVDAALAGLRKGEEVTIPPLADETLWTAYEAARAALGPHLSRRDVAPRYRRAGT